MLPLLQNRPLFQAICPGSLWARDNRWLLSRVQRLAGPVGGDGGLFSRLETPSGTKGGAFYPGWWPFVPVGATNRDKRPPFYFGWCLQPGQNSLAPLSPSFSPARAIQLTCSCCSWLEREEFLLISSPHLWRSLIPCPSIGAKGLGLIFLFFLGLYSSFHASEIEKMCS